MKAIVTENTRVLVPNKEHKNFTTSDEIIEAETIVEGEPKNIIGLRKGQPFTYKLFYTKEGKIIYIKKIKPMEKTEVVLSADSTVTETKVELPNQSNLGKRPVIGAVIGVVGVYAFCKHKKYDHKKTLIFTAIGGVAGFVVGKYLQSHNPVKVVASK